MATKTIPVDQRLIDIDSRRFASIEKALVELITNCDDSYARVKPAVPQSGIDIRVTYERHQAGAALTVTDHAEGITFERACEILSYGAAHSPLARGETEGRGYFGRGLKQAIYGLGYGWLETIRDGRYTRIELFRARNGGYLYDDGDGDRPALSEDYETLAITGNGTRVGIVIDNPQVNISRFHSLVQAVADNIYLREILKRRSVELASLTHGKPEEEVMRVYYIEPEADVVLGPELVSHFIHDGKEYPFTITLKRASTSELTLRGDTRTNGLLVVSGTAVLDCQFFDFENQVGTEYLFGRIECPALIEALSHGEAIISDEREGLNTKHPIVAAFSRAVSRIIAPSVAAEVEKLARLPHAVTSNRTGHMIEHLLERMSRAAIEDFGITLPPMETQDASAQTDAALRFTTPFYYRRPGHPFHIALLVDAGQFETDDVLQIEYHLSEGLRIDPAPEQIPLCDLGESKRIEWTVVSDDADSHGEISVHAGDYLAWCEVVISESASTHVHRHAPVTEHHTSRKHTPRDHGEIMFTGYDIRNLGNDLERAVYSPEERKILINTAAPTVQLYLDGRGRFRDSARLLLAELFMDVISDELARYVLMKKPDQNGDVEAYHAAKQEIIRRYGSDIHHSFLNG